MKNNKFTNVPPLVDNNITVQDPTEQSNIFNNFFASKSTVNDMDDPIPFLQQKEGIQIMNSINTSPIVVARFIRIINCRKIFLHFPIMTCVIPSMLVYSQQLIIHIIMSQNVPYSETLPISHPSQYLIQDKNVDDRLYYTASQMI